MTKPRLTPAQQRALDWLPKDGSWRDNAGRLSQALVSLRRDFRDFIHAEHCGYHKGTARVRYRLTPAGIALFHPATETTK